MNNTKEQVIHARALQAAIVGSPAAWLPRREILLDWLADFLARAGTSNYQVEAQETADLGALEQFLRRLKVPVAQ